MIVLKEEDLDNNLKDLIKTCIHKFHSDNRLELFTRIFKALENSDGSKRMDLLINNVVEKYREELKEGSDKDRSIQTNGLDCR